MTDLERDKAALRAFAKSIEALPVPTVKTIAGEAWKRGSCATLAKLVEDLRKEINEHDGSLN